MTALEQTVAAVWAEVLGLESVGPDDDFYALGGTSLDVVRIVARLEEELGTDVSVRALLETGTVRAMVRRLVRRLA